MNNRKLLKFFLAFFDYCLLLLAMFIVLKIRIPSTYYSTLYYDIFLPLFGFWILIFYLFELYTIGLPEKLTRLYFALIICVLLSSLLFYLFSFSFIIAPKTNLALIAVIFTFLHYLWRQLFEFIYVRFFKGHAIIVTVSDTVSFELVKKIQKNYYMKYHIIGVITTKEFYEELCTIIEKEKTFTDIKLFKKEIKKYSYLKSIIVTNYWFVNLSRVLYTAFHQSINVVNLTNFFEQLFHYIPIRGTNQYWIMNNINILSHSVYAFLKRILDILLALLFIPIFLIPMIGIAIAIKLFGGKGNILDIQPHIGQHLKLFHRYKFRITKNKKNTLINKTTSQNNIEDIDTHLQEKAKSTNAMLNTLGKFLKVTRLDELPQLFNVLKGDISFIGPQSEPIEIDRMLEKEIPHYQLRYLTKPGLVGWAQVNSRFKHLIKDYELKLCYDLFYTKNMNIVMDTEIFIKTLRTIFTTPGK